MLVQGRLQWLASIALLSLAVLALGEISSELQAALRYVKKHEDRYDNDLLELAAIPSVATLPDHAGDVDRAADWLVQRFTTAGLKAKKMAAGGQPLVVAHHTAAGAAAATVLIYGHFDVQPAADTHAWDNPPFSPQLRNRTFYGRGVSDDKGGVLQSLQAVEALLASGGGKLPLNIRFLVEGEEEIGSPHLGTFLEQHADEIRADIILSADGGQISPVQPGIILGMRGATAFEILVETAAGEVHSGAFGGSIPNAAHAMTTILNSLRHDNGTIAVAGFLDDVVEMTRDDDDDIAAFGFDEAAEAAELGVSAFTGEEGFSTLARRWHRPTLEVVGMYSGYTGEGVLNIIPNKAVAKITARLVPDQNVERCLESVRQHIARHAPLGCNATLRASSFQAEPYAMARDAAVVRVASDVLTEVMGNKPLFYRSGATIGALALFKQHLQRGTLVFGFGLPTDRVHAANERFSKEMYNAGRRAYMQLLLSIASQHAPHSKSDRAVHEEF